MSQTVGVIRRETLPYTVVDELDFWAARLNANQTEVNQRLDASGLGVYNVKDYGAIGDGVTDDYAAVMDAYNAMPTDHKGILYFPPGVYAHSLKLNLVGTDIRVLGNNAITYFTGAGIAVTMDGGSYEYYGCQMENLTIRGNPNCTKGLVLDRVNHGRFVDISVQDCTTTGIEFLRTVCNYAANLRVSANERSFVTQPGVGINLGATASANTLVNPIVEGVSGIGITINGGIHNVIIGGTSEGNTGGLSFLAGTGNEVYGMDCESNSATDFDVAASGKNNAIVGCVGGSSGAAVGLTVRNNAYLTMIQGCQFHTIDVQAAAYGTTILNTAYSVSGAGGTYANAGTNSVAFNVYNLFTPSAVNNVITNYTLPSTWKWEWDNGSGTLDVNMYRGGANLLTTDDDLQVAGGDVTLGATDATGVRWSRDGTGPTLNAVKADGSGYCDVRGATVKATVAFEATGGSAATAVTKNFVTGDTVPRLYSDAGGALFWGAGGSSAVDTTLYRLAANQLATDDAFLCQRSVEAVTSTKSPSAAESRELYTNQGDADGATVTLPTAAAGLEYSFYVQTAQTLTITAASGDTIRIAGAVTASGGSITCNIVGSAITLVAINATEWVATSIVGPSTGNWTI